MMTSVTNRGATAHERADALAAEVERITGDLLETLRGCDDVQWRQVTASEQWPVGVVAHHVAEVAAFFTGLVAGVVSGKGRGVILSDDEIEQNNARHAAEHAGVGKREVIALLDQRGPALARQIRQLHDGQLGKIAGVFGGRPLTVGQVLELGVVGHFTEHLASIRAAVSEVA